MLSLKRLFNRHDTYVVNANHRIAICAVNSAIPQEESQTGEAILVERGAAWIAFVCVVE